MVVGGKMGGPNGFLFSGGIFLLCVFTNEGRMGEIKTRENPERWVSEEQVQIGGVTGSILLECVF